MGTALMWFRQRMKVLGVESEKGATAVEYGLLVGLIAVAIVVTVLALGGQLNTMFCEVVTALGGAC